MRFPLRTMSKLLSILTILSIVSLTCQYHGLAQETWVPPSVEIPVFYVTDRQSAPDINSDRYLKKRRYHSGCDYGLASVNVALSRNAETIKGKLWEMGWRPSNTKVGDREKYPPPANLASTEKFGVKDAFFAELKKAASISSTGKAILFVHGYNSDFEGAMETAAQLSYFFQAPVISFSWPSQHEAVKYTWDECNVEWSLRDFRLLLRDLDKSILPENLIIVSHSMGNRLVFWALTARADIAQAAVSIDGAPGNPPQYAAVFLSSPDVDAGTMKNWSYLLSRNAERNLVMISHRDIPLRLSRGVHGDDRMGAARHSKTSPDVDVDWKIPETLYHMDTIDFTHIDKQPMGHSIPFRELARIYHQQDLGNGLKLNKRKVGKQEWYVIEEPSKQTAGKSNAHK
jgi:esterase/lipase superfamily enzyme